MDAQIKIELVKVSTYHRQIKPWLLSEVTRSMREHGYNPAYPIVVDDDNNLIEGRHRLEGALAVGLESVPYIRKPADISSIRFGLQCNADGQLTAADDVFDLAALCWNLANSGWTGQAIADELGWTPGKVSQYSAIKQNLHKRAWALAKFTKIPDVVNPDTEGAVNPEFTIVNWVETPN